MATRSCQSPARNATANYANFTDGTLRQSDRQDASTFLEMFGNAARRMCWSALAAGRRKSSLAILERRAAELSAGRSLHWRGARIFHHGRPNRHSRLGRPLLSSLALAVSRAAAPLRPARSEEGELHRQWEIGSSGRIRRFLPLVSARLKRVLPG